MWLDILRLATERLRIYHAGELELPLAVQPLDLLRRDDVERWANRSYDSGRTTTVGTPWVPFAARAARPSVRRTNAGRTVALGAQHPILGVRRGVGARAPPAPAPHRAPRAPALRPPPSTVSRSLLPLRDWRLPARPQRAPQLCSAKEDDAAELALPPGLTRMQLDGEAHSGSLAGLRLPDSLRELTLGECWSQSADHWPALPEGLQLLSFGEWFNAPLDGVRLPVSLRDLRIGAAYNQQVQPAAAGSRTAAAAAHAPALGERVRPSAGVCGAAGPRSRGSRWATVTRSRCESGHHPTRCACCV